MRSGHVGVLGLVIIGAAAPAMAQEQAPAPPSAPSPAPAAERAATPPSALTFGVGASDWSGDYGASSNTEITAVLFSARYRIDGLRLSASLPWMRIDSPGAVYTGVEGTPLVVAPDQPVTGDRKREGLGDLTLGANYLAPSDRVLGLDVDLSARVKVPTASDSSGLSTGEVDYSFAVEVSKSFDRFAPFVRLGYRAFGDSSQWRLKDGPAASVGASYIFAHRIVGVMSYDYAQHASRYIGDSHELVASLSAPLPNSSVRLTGFLGAGLSSGAADVSGGVSLSLSL